MIKTKSGKLFFHGNGNGIDDLEQFGLSGFRGMEEKNASEFLPKRFNSWTVKITNNRSQDLPIRFARLFAM